MYNLDYIKYSWQLRRNWQKIYSISCYALLCKKWLVVTDHT